ncbi:hypothetical protein CASFOL_036668 [Castilleja foliolosa]|uniref:RNase H type-1 domain-containing protein n=1 Tax=Castilleja foliolosa TaxID=1961234 RepID=A0ABD3BPF5_9LAMI
MGLSILKITGTGTTPRSIFRSLKWYRGARMVSTVDGPDEEKSLFPSSISPLLMLSPGSNNTCNDLYNSGKSEKSTFGHATKIAGWFACFNLYLQNELFLLNPLRVRHFNLPPVHNLEICRYDLRISCSDPESTKCRAMDSVLEAWDLRNPRSPCLVYSSDSAGQSDPAQTDVSAGPNHQQYPVVSQKGELFLVYRYVYPYMLPDGSCATMDPEEDSYSESGYPRNYKVFNIAREGDDGGKKVNMDDQVMFVGILSHGMAIPAADAEGFQSPSLVWSCGVNKLDYCSDDSVGQSDPAQNDVSRSNYPLGRRRTRMLGVNKNLNRHHSMPLFKPTRLCLEPGTRHLVTFTKPERFKCPICKTSRSSREVGRGKSVDCMENHFLISHNPIHRYASKHELICKCGVCFDDVIEFREHQKTCDYLQWKAPRVGFIKLNSDGCCKWNLYPGNDASDPDSENKPGESGGGGLIRDTNGFCDGAYQVYFGISTSKLAELASLIIGVILTRQDGYKNVLIETDCASVVEDLERTVKTGFPDDIYDRICTMDPCIMKPDKCLYEDHLLIAKFLLNDNNFNYEISHVFREANKPADGLANQGYQTRNWSILQYNQLIRDIKNRIIDDRDIWLKKKRAAEQGGQAII